MVDTGSRIDQVLADYLKSRDSGLRVAPAELIAAHPELAEELQAYFRMSELVDRMIDTDPVEASATFFANGQLQPPPGYELRGEVARGGMGIVYRAFRQSTHSDVALKVLPPGLAADPLRLMRFRQEAATASQLTANHVLPIHDVIAHQGAHFIVMPHIDGCNLAQVIHRRRESADSDDPWGRAQLSDLDYVERMLHVGDQLLEAVSAIHEAGILHRDIKPSNVLVDRRGDVWLCDFGLAHLAAEHFLTSPGDMLGTRGYMSPEQDEGRDDVDERADIFGLGVTLIEALTLRLPYGKGPITEDSPLPAPPSRTQRLISRELDAILLKSIEPQRRRRFTSVRDFQRDWQLVRRGQRPRSRPITTIQRIRRWTGRNFLTIAAMAGAAIVGAFLTAGVRSFWGIHIP